MSKFLLLSSTGFSSTWFSLNEEALQNCYDMMTFQVNINALGQLLDNQYTF